MILNVMLVYRYLHKMEDRYLMQNEIEILSWILEQWKILMKYLNEQMYWSCHQKLEIQDFSAEWLISHSVLQVRKLVGPEDSSTEFQYCSKL